MEVGGVDKGVERGVYGVDGLVVVVVVVVGLLDGVVVG